MNAFITGGLGFIGSNFTNKYIEKTKNQVFVLDNESYSSNKLNLNSNKARIKTVDIRDLNLLDNFYSSFKPDITFHFAAQTHVDNSIKNDDDFITTNIIGTHNILKCIVKYGGKLIHVSTDEVYGSLNEGDDSFKENSPYAPNNPYAASKASSDLLVRSYIKTHKIKAVITNCSNNYGPRQHEEKLIPTIIKKAKANEKIPIYGNGTNVRDWLYVEDHCDALIKISENFISGERYNIGGGFEVTNIEITKKILNLMGKSENLIEFIKDRSGHDFRYSINSSKIKKELNWEPKTDIGDGLKKTLEWYYA